MQIIPPELINLDTTTGVKFFRIQLSGGSRWVLESEAMTLKLAQ